MSGKRVLLTGQEVPETAEPVTLAVHTRCPSKWLFVDLETNDFWVSDGAQFSRAPSGVLTGMVAATWNYLAAVQAAHGAEGTEPVKPMLTSKQRGAAELIFFEVLLLLGVLGTFAVILLTR